MNYFWIGCIFVFLTACRHNYPNLGDVPDYTPPSLSLDEAKKELEELKQERIQAQKFAAKHPPVVSDSRS